MCVIKSKNSCFYVDSAFTVNGGGSSLKNASINQCQLQSHAQSNSRESLHRESKQEKADVLDVYITEDRKHNHFLFFSLDLKAASGQSM